MLNAVKRFRRLLDDYFPTSKHSSSAVKLAACLTEAATVWAATGGAVLTGARGGKTLALAAGRGDIPRDVTAIANDGSLAARCFSRGKQLSVADLSEEESPLIHGIEAASAACVPVKAGDVVLGVLVLWSDDVGHFSDDDLGPLSLFGQYVAILLEVDELGDRLGENLLVDPLTGLHNRRQFDSRLRQEVERARRYTLQVSLIIFDIDSLESYNEACGHMMGNLALSDIASILERGTREVDFVARVGGDEFATVLPETNRLGAIRLADRLRAEIAAYPFPVPEDKASANITVSAGVAAFPSSAGDEQELLARCYQALDEAKREGGDNIKLYQEE